MTTPAEKWRRIEEAWVTYCQRGADAFDWDFDSRDLMGELTDHHPGEGRPTRYVPRPRAETDEQRLAEEAVLTGIDAWLSYRGVPT